MKKRAKFSIWYFLTIFASIFFLESLFFSAPAGKEISYNKFRNLLAADSIQTVIIQQDKIYGQLIGADTTAQKTVAVMGTAKNDSSKVTSSNTAKPAFIPKHFYTPWRLKISQTEKEYQAWVKREFNVVPLDDPNLIADLQKHGVDYRGKLDSHWFSNLFFNWVIPFGLLFLVWGFLFRRMGGGRGVLNIGKSKAKIFEADQSQRVTFEDVAGIEEAVEEVKELVHFLKAPDQFTRLGAKLPKGLLLVGPPGTGKTLLARAVAGEADVPFYSLSGSDFVEMFVGVGAARVRDLFAEAKAHAPCIIFIDELDAVGKSRSQTVVMGGYDERENTLNQLLTEMDGFDAGVGVVIIGATNRPEVLDVALLRPGRFDRQILVDRPDLNGRIQIFEVHTRTLPLSEDVDMKRLASMTPGFAGAEIANVCNEAALLASRKGRTEIVMEDFQDAIERVIAGLEKKNKLINPHEREVVAFHESGHAIVGYFTPGADPVQKVSIIPRGIGALGYTLQTPLEDRYLMSRNELLGKIKGLLGGRAAEAVVFGEISTGASNDLERVTQIARDMITVYGMSKYIPNISLAEHTNTNFLGLRPPAAPHSEKLERLIDDEVLEIIQTCYEADKKLLAGKRELLDAMAQRLLEKEKIEQAEIKQILGPRPIIKTGQTTVNHKRLKHKKSSKEADTCKTTTG